MKLNYIIFLKVFDNCWKFFFVVLLYYCVCVNGLCKMECLIVKKNKYKMIIFDYYDGGCIM